MPNLFVVGDEKNLADLAPSLLRSRTSAAARASALEAIRRANPGLDFDRIQPGTVVLVPPEVAVRRPAADADPVRQAADGLAGTVREGVKALAAASEAAEEQRALEQKAAQGLLGSRLLERLAAGNPELKANVASVRATLEADDAEARRQLGSLREAGEAWTAELDALRTLLLP